MNMSEKASKECGLSRILKAPIRVLVKVRDFYVKSMWEYGDRVSYGTVIGCSTGQANALPRSYSVTSTTSSSGDDDLRELIRVASTRSLRDKVQLENIGRKQHAARQCSNGNGANNMPRSHSVGIGRIDEDKPCEFEEHVQVRTDHVFARSRSYAVNKRNGAFL